MKYVWILLTLTICLSFCGTTGSVEVAIDVPDLEALDWGRIDQIYFLPFIYSFEGIKDSPDEQFRKFFTGDFAAFVDKTINPLDIPEWEKVRGGENADEFNFDNPAFFQSLLSEAPKGMVLTGLIRLTAKSTSVIRQVKDENGKKKNAFVPQEFWDIDSRLLVIDAQNGKIVLDRPLKEKNIWEEPVSLRFKMDRLLEKLSDRLYFDFKMKKKKEQRYLILK